MAKAKPTLITVYVMQKIYWFYNDEYDDPLGGNAILTFRDRAKAEQHRQELERRVRRGEVEQHNPFGMAGYGLEEQTSLNHEELAEAVAALGLEPAGDEGDWCSWWEDNDKQLTPDQREAIWILMDELAFYEIVEQELLVHQ